MFWTSQFLVGFVHKFNLLVFLIGIADHVGPLVQYFLGHKKINLLVFLIGIADHAGPLVMHRTEWREERKQIQKPHSSTKQISL
jgi:hypothetical protein